MRERTEADWRAYTDNLIRDYNDLMYRHDVMCRAYSEMRDERDAEKSRAESAELELGRCYAQMEDMARQINALTRGGDDA